MGTFPTKPQCPRHLRQAREGGARHFALGLRHCGAHPATFTPFSCPSVLFVRASSQVQKDWGDDNSEGGETSSQGPSLELDPNKKWSVTTPSSCLPAPHPIPAPTTTSLCCQSDHLLATFKATQRSHHTGLFSSSQPSPQISASTPLQRLLLLWDADTPYPHPTEASQIPLCTQS